MLKRILKIEFLLNLYAMIFLQRVFLSRYEIRFVFYRQPVNKQLAFEW